MSDKRSVLLVDDVKLFLNLEETFFKRSGYDVFTAMNGTDALKIARKHKPDLILLDYIMSDFNGDEVCRQLKADPETKDSVIIIVTTRYTPEDIKRFKDAGCDDIVTKPVNQTKLLDKAAKFLNIPSRVHFRILVKIEIEGRWEKGFFFGQSYDISKSGMLVETDSKLDLGTPVNVHFVVPGSKEPLKIGSVVTRLDETRPNDKTGIGIRFVDLTPEQSTMISNFIDSKASRK